MALTLYPHPRQVRSTGGPVALPSQIAIQVQAEHYPVLSRALKALQEALPKARLHTTAFPREAYPIALSIDSTIDHDQGYDVVIGVQSTSIRAATTTGLHYALLTFTQIVEQSPTDTLPRLRISDRPAIETRGVMLDISRCKVPTLATLKELVTQFSALKINQLQLYTEHTFAFVDHRRVWKDASPLEPADILELDDFCRRHFIELVPNFNSFGHWERWLRHPPYKKYANSPKGYTNPWGTAFPHGSLLKPDRDTLELLDSLYAEMLPNFSSNKFNVGCDETFELGTEWSKELCERRGTERVYLDFLKQINQLSRKHDKTMMFWGDIIMKHPELIPRLPRKVIALEWGYEANHPFATDCKAFARSGIPFYVCPGTSSWNSLTGRTGNALDNLLSAARNGTRQGAAGYLITDWGDNGHHQYLPVSYLPFTAGAVLAWNANRQPDLEYAAGAVFFRDQQSARLFAALGRVHESFTTPFFNSNVFHHLLFHGQPAHEKLLNLKTSELKNAAKNLNELREQNRQINDLLIRREFRNTIDMALFAVHRGLLLKGQTSRNRILPRIQRDHRELWLARNRPGGLRESLSRFPAS